MMFGKFPRLVDDGDVVTQAYDVVFDWTFGRHIVSYNEVVLDWKIFDTTEWCGGADGMASIAFLKIMMSYSIGHSVDTL
jgi:hypothetical protein